MRDFSQNFCGKRIFFRYLQSQTGRKFPAGRISSAVEHFTRNEGVPSSNLVKRPPDMSGGLFTYREVRNLRKAAATAAPREQAGSPKQAGTPPRQSGPAPEQTGTTPENRKNARTSRKASRQSETRSPEPKCGRRTPCHPKACGSGRKEPAAPRKSGQIEKPSEQLKTASGRPVAGTTFRNGNRPKPDAGNDRSETPPNKKIAPREPFVLFFISLPR